MIFTTAALFSLVAVVAKAQTVSISALSLSQCATSTIDFSGSTGPYYVALLQAENPCDNDAIKEFFDVYDTSVSYTVDLAAGTQVVVYVEDANQAESWSNTITVGGGDNSCLPGYVAPEEQPTTEEPTYEAPSYEEPADVEVPAAEVPDVEAPDVGESKVEDDAPVADEVYSYSVSRASSSSAYDSTYSAPAAKNTPVAAPLTLTPSGDQEETEETNVIGNDSTGADGAANAVNAASELSIKASAVFGAMLVACVTLL